MTIEHIKLTSYEHRVMQFWKENANAASVKVLENLIDEHDEYVNEAGPNGHLCEYTVEMLAPIKAEIGARLEVILERYADWATD
jgi:hypothetical protein